jgi:uncharacterized protein involved in exopolysaccharide biosynthesis
MNDNLENKEMLEEALDQRSLATEGTQESSIDFGKIFKDLLKHKKLYYKVLPVAFILAAIYAISLPNYYSCTVKLSPELSGGSGSKSGLASLASSFGVNLGSALGNSTEALFPTLYPDLMNSVDFKTSLFEIQVTREEDNKTFTYYDYLMNEQKAPWWSQAKKAVFSMFNDQSSMVNDKKVDPFRLTKEQTDIVKAIDKNVVCDVDKKTMVITINVTDQDPLICATMADSVKTRLQKFITDYRTSKARVDLEYNQKLFVEAREKYEQARNRYAAYADSHRNVSSQSAQTKQADLQNEMQMQQQIYQQVVAQLQQAEMKVQQETPAFTTLQSATVPVRKTGPKRAQMCLIFLFLAFLGTTAYILHKEDDLKPLLGLS